MLNIREGARQGDISRSDAIKQIAEATGLSVDAELLDHLLLRADPDEEYEHDKSFLDEELFRRALRTAKRLAGSTRRERETTKARTGTAVADPFEFFQEKARMLKKNLSPMAQTWREEHLGTLAPLQTLEDMASWIEAEHKKEKEGQQCLRFEVEVVVDIQKWPKTVPTSRTMIEALAKALKESGSIRDITGETLSYLTPDGSSRMISVNSSQATPLSALKKVAAELAEQTMVGSEADWVAFVLLGDMPVPYVPMSAEFSIAQMRVPQDEKTIALRFDRLFLSIDPWISPEELSRFYAGVKKGKRFKMMLPGYLAKRPQAKTLALLSYAREHGASLESFTRWNEEYSQWKYKTLGSFQVSISKARKTYAKAFPL